MSNKAILIVQIKIYISTNKLRNELILQVGLLHV
jgi:hypothetical protein